MKHGLSLREKLELRSELNETTGCRIWRDATEAHHNQKTLYIKHGGKVLSVLRAVYELKTGEPLDPFVQLRHTCKNTRCINADHLKVVGLNTEGHNKR